MKLSLTKYISYLLIISLIITVSLIVISYLTSTPPMESPSKIFTQYFSLDNAKQTPSSILNAVMVLFGIFFTIVVVTFSLNNRLPFFIVKDIIIFSKETYLILLNLSFSIMFLSLLSLQNMSILDYYLIIIDLLMAVVSLVFYFLWYSNKIDLDTILKDIVKDFKKDYFKKNNKFDNIDNTRKYLIALFEDEQEKRKFNYKTIKVGYANLLEYIIEESNEITTNDLQNIRKFLDDISLHSYSKEESHKFIAEILYKLKYANDNEDLRLTEYVVGLLFTYFSKYYSDYKLYDKIEFPITLYFAEQIRYKFYNLFESTQEVEIIDKQCQIMSKVIDYSLRIIKAFVKGPYLHSKSKDDRHLKKLIQDFISSIDYYHDSPYDYNRDYLTLTALEKELIGKKVDSVKKLKNQIEKAKLQMAFWLFYNIQKGYLPTQLLKSVVFPLLNLCKDLYYPVDLDIEIFLNELHPSATFVETLDNNVVRILYYIYSYKSTHAIPTNRLPAPIFSNKMIIHSLHGSFDNISESDLELIGSNMKEYNKFKRLFLPKLEEISIQAEEHEEEYIISQELSQAKINTFKDNLIKEWESKTFVRRLFQINDQYTKINEDDKSIVRFGITQIMERSYFIDNPPVQWAGSLSSDIGRGIARGENNQLMETLIKHINKFRSDSDEPQSIIEGMINRMESLDGLSIIISGESFYYIEDSLRNIEFKWNIKEPSGIEQLHNFRGYFIKDEIKIPIFHYTSENNIVLVVNFKKLGILKEYAFDGMQEKENLFISVKELNEDEKRQIKEQDKKVTEERLRLEIMIKVFEKFELENINKNAGLIFNFKDINPHK